MTSLSAFDRKLNSWLKKTQTQFILSIRESQDQLRDIGSSYATSVCIEVDHVFYYYHPSNRGKDMVFSALASFLNKGNIDFG